MADDSAEGSGDSMSGMGDDDDLEIGGTVAGMRQGPVTENITNKTETNTMTQNVMTVAPSMAMVMDPANAGFVKYVPVPGY
jgi:hypothetical protein